MFKIIRYIVQYVHNGILLVAKQLNIAVNLYNIDIYLYLNIFESDDLSMNTCEQ